MEACEVAKKYVGVDVLTDELEQLRPRGYEVRNADLASGPLDERAWITNHTI
jgi:hypothetical protein